MTLKKSPYLVKNSKHFLILDVGGKILILAERIKKKSAPGEFYK